MGWMDGWLVWSIFPEVGALETEGAYADYERELITTMGTWAKHVDTVLCLLGLYSSTPAPLCASIRLCGSVGVSFDSSSAIFMCARTRV